ncbi:hypothetical protein BKA57DRAFT_128988 [Linnemannia elongata]|nr:hypothetical protein BKA57DRAFT_128988 [Linnemannia elongata]
MVTQAYHSLSYYLPLVLLPFFYFPHFRNSSFSLIRSSPSTFLFPSLFFVTFRFLSSFEPSLSALGHSFRRFLKFLIE